MVEQLLREKHLHVDFNALVKGLCFDGSFSKLADHFVGMNPLLGRFRSIKPIVHNILRLMEIGLKAMLKEVLNMTKSNDENNFAAAENKVTI